MWILLAGHAKHAVSVGVTVGGTTSGRRPPKKMSLLKRIHKNNLKICSSLTCASEATALWRYRSFIIIIIIIMYLSTFSADEFLAYNLLKC